MQNVRFAFRMLRNNPGFSIVAILTLALGIGANSAIFSVVNTVLLRPYPFPEPDRLVVVWENLKRRNIPYMFTAPPNYADFRDQNRTFEVMAAFNPTNAFLQQDTESVRLYASQVTASFFPLVGVAPMFGRGFTEEEEGAGKGKVAVLSYNVWRDRFGSDPNVVGKTIVLNDESHTVVGVMPRGFTFPPAIDLEGGKLDRHNDVWIPFSTDMEAGQRGAHFLRTLARLKTGTIVDDASLDVSTIAQRLAKEHPNTNDGWDASVVLLTDQVLGDVRPALMALLGAVGFVLLIACINVANLLLARGAVRKKEFAVRLALGASRGQLIRLMLVESVILSVLGSLAGLGLASWSIDALVMVAPQNVPRLDETVIDGTVIAFTVGLALLTGVLCGVTPALQAFKFDTRQSIQEGGRNSSVGRGPVRIRSVLIVAEIAMSLALLVGSGLLFQSFVRLRSVDAGFKPDNVLTMRLTLPQTAFTQPESRIAAYRDLEQRLKGLPGVSSAGFVYEIPLTADRQGTSITSDRRAMERREGMQTNFTFATPGYFPAIGIPVVQGRNFSDQDGRGKTDVVIINAALARQLFGSENPIGKVVYLEFNPAVSREVIGVVGDERHNTLRDSPVPNVYSPFYQVPWSNSMSLAMRTEMPAGSAVSAIREQVNAVTPNVPIYDVKTMNQVLDEALVQARFSGVMTAVFSAFAIVLAAVGISGFISFIVAQRKQEIGIRMALGAKRADILRMVLTQGMKLASTGIGLGVMASLVFGRLLRSLLFGVSPVDAPTIAGISFLLTLIVLIACYVPARSAGRVDPNVALRLSS